MAGKLAEAFVEIRADDRPFRSGLSSVESQLGGSIGRMSGMATGLWSAVANQGIQAMSGMARGIAAGVQDAIAKAGDLNESVSKVQATFQDSAGTILGAADAMAAKFGSTKQVFIDGAANIGLIGKGAGMAREEAAKFGVQFAKLADDIASFDNVSFEDAMVALRAGLVGETEPLRRFGVTITEAATQAEAFRMGLGKTKAELDTTDKITARASLIMQGFTDRIGDHERTQGSLNNRIREAQGRWENLRAELGQRLVPVMQEVAGGFGGLVESLQVDLRDPTSQLNAMGEAWKTAFADIGALLRENAGSMDTWKDRVIAALRAVGDATGDITGAVRAFDAMVADANKGEADFSLVDTLFPEIGRGRVAMGALHDIGMGPREADRGRDLDAKLAAESDKQLNRIINRAAARAKPFVGPEAPRDPDLLFNRAVQGIRAVREAALTAEITNARKAVGMAMIERPTLGGAGGRLLGGLMGGGGLAGAGLGILSDAAANNNAPAWMQRLARAGEAGGPAGLMGGLAGMGMSGLESFRASAPRRDFQSSMMNTSDIASEVTKAALSKKDSTEKNTERTAKATEETARGIKKLVDSRGRTYARFAPKGAK